MLQFHLAQLRKRGVERELVRIARVDTAHQRFDQPLERLAAQSACDECSHGLIAVNRARGQKEIHLQSHFAER